MTTRQMIESSLLLPEIQMENPLYTRIFNYEMDKLKTGLKNGKVGKLVLNILSDGEKKEVRNMLLKDKTVGPMIIDASLGDRTLKNNVLYEQFKLLEGGKKRRSRKGSKKRKSRTMDPLVRNALYYNQFMVDEPVNVRGNVSITSDGLTTTQRPNNQNEGYGGPGYGYGSPGYGYGGPGYGKK